MRWIRFVMVGRGAVVLMTGAVVRGQDESPAVEEQPAALMTNGAALTPFGPEDEITAGEALVLKLKQGGMTMVFLFVVSIFGVACALERAFRLNRKAIVPAGLAEKAAALWRAGKYDEVKALAEKDKSALAQTLAAVAKHPHMHMADVSTIAGDVASRNLRRHIQRAYPLAIVATISPLLGLLGTVIGMIGAFDKVAAAGSLGDASMLGGDISKALITTATGLCIAVPALALYHFFKSRTNGYGMLLEEEVSELLTEWFAQDGPSGRGGQTHEA